jgi:class 3 adenylate cyclase
MLTCPNCGRENADDARFCQSCGRPLATADAPREARKVVTVLFSDVTGSTGLGERLDPETMRRVMARYFAEMKTALVAHGGTVEKFIGDAVMAVFGIPVLHEDDALRAVRAAMDMKDRLSLLNAELERDRGLSILTRTGINTGEVVAGDPATGQTLVTGDAVNVAARLEQSAGPGRSSWGRPHFGCFVTRSPPSRSLPCR